MYDVSLGGPWPLQNFYLFFNNLSVFYKYLKVIYIYIYIYNNKKKKGVGPSKESIDQII